MDAVPPTMSDALSRKDLAEKHPQRRLWRSLEELQQTDEFREMLTLEFPDAVDTWEDGPSRRNFLKIMGASLALAGVGVGAAGCTRRPSERIVPYVRQPEHVVLGRSLMFATAYTFRGYARGILVESHEGRPTKIEGNELHPASLGATDAIGQAHVLNLYDPDRARIVTRYGDPSSWTAFATALGADLDGRRATGRRGLYVLSESFTSPTLTAQMQALLKAYPEARWHQYDAVGFDNTREGVRRATGGQNLEPVYRFDAAKVIVSLDENFLSDLPGSVRYARDFINGRRVAGKPADQRTMNRLYVAETTPTITGAMADHRVRLKPTALTELARQLAAALGRAAGGVGGGATTEAVTTPAGATASDWIRHVVVDLNANRGASLVLCGESQPPEVHAIVHSINAQLGNVGKTVNFIDPVIANPASGIESLRALCADMDAGKVETLIILGGNPVYDAPADLNFGDLLNRQIRGGAIKLAAHLGLHEDETSFQCHWHMPLSHELEAWSDARAYDGTATIMQPLIEPLYQTRSLHEMAAILLGQRDRSGYEIVREHWQGVHNNAGDFEPWWVKALNDGVVAESASQPRQVNINGQVTSGGGATTQPADAGPATGNLEIAFRPDPHVWDGRFANNGWLMELPRPLTRLTWDNVALVSRATAQRLALGEQHSHNSKPTTPIIELNQGGRSIKAPVWVLPGHPDDCITVYLGFGRTRVGRVGNGAGYNAYPLRTSSNPWALSGASVIQSRDGEAMLACVQNHAMMNQQGRDLVHVAPIQLAGKTIEPREPGLQVTEPEPKAGQPGHVNRYPLSLYPEEKWQPMSGDANTRENKWGMVIDQNACIGCNACVAACQSENNIPVVGKDQVSRGREMHWLRIDNYYGGDPDASDTIEGPYFQPLPCMHCEKAPCELVCPVNATVHDNEGLNNMVYNRCVGTRYCSNNCPYKVRHFNFLHYQDVVTETFKMMRNPNVTVRSRGVMEKCTYCVQRISRARIDSKREYVNGERPLDAVYDGEVITACAQACPTQAIVFGNLDDNYTQQKDASGKVVGKGSLVAVLSKDPTNYSLLEELQTQPRTTYLPRFTNPANADRGTGALPVRHES